MEKLIQINKFLLHRIKHTSKKHRASQGMTAAIILIAFIITAAGIAFVILTMGSNMQQNLGTIGEKGSEASSSALQLEGGLVIGYDIGGDGGVDAFTFRIKVVLETGLVDLQADSVEMFALVDNDPQITLDEEVALVTEANFVDTTGAPTDGYSITISDGDGDEILEPGEIAKFLVQLPAGTPVTANQKIVIAFISGVAMIRIEKTMPTGVDSGSNILA